MGAVTSHDPCPVGQMQLVPAVQSELSLHGCPGPILAAHMGGVVVASQRADSSQGTGFGADVCESSKHGSPTVGGFLHTPTVESVRPHCNGARQ